MGKKLTHENNDYYIKLPDSRLEEESARANLLFYPFC